MKRPYDVVLAYVEVVSAIDSSVGDMCRHGDACMKSKRGAQRSLHQSTNAGATPLRFEPNEWSAAAVIGAAVINGNGVCYC